MATKNFGQFPTAIPTANTQLSGYESPVGSGTESKKYSLAAIAAFIGSSDLWHPEITSLSGSGSSSLDSVVTAGTLPANETLYIFVNGATEGLQFWQLQAGTDATDGVGIQRPLDFNLSTNPKIWVKVL